MGSQRRILLDVLMILFGFGSWLGVNAFFVQLPLLVERLPERWALPSSMTIAVQLGNSGLIIYAVLRRLFPRASDVPYIYTLLVILTGSLYLNSFLYTQTVVIGGTDRSLAFLALSFGVALVGCTSSILFYPYLRHFREVYLSTYLVGEGLSGFIPSILALIQGVGDHPECIYSEDGTTVEIVFPPPRFNSTAFFIIVGCLGLVSLLSFVLIDNLPSFLSERISKDSDSKTKEKPISSHNEKEDITVSKHTFNVFDKNLIGVYVLLACLNALMNGTLPSIQSYSCMPYGRDIYHLAVTLGAMSNPVACMAGVWLKPVRGWVLAVMLSVILVPVGYIFSTAALSPAPPMYTETFGKVLIVLCWVSVLGVVSYARMWVYGYARRGGGSTMKVCGAAGQAGSMLGSLTTYCVINFGGVFTQVATCPLPSMN